MSLISTGCKVFPARIIFTACETRALIHLTMSISAYLTSAKSQSVFFVSACACLSTCVNTMHSTAARNTTKFRGSPISATTPARGPRLSGHRSARIHALAILDQNGLIFGAYHHPSELLIGCRNYQTDIDAVQLGVQLLALRVGRREYFVLKIFGPSKDRIMYRVWSDLQRARFLAGTIRAGRK